MAKAKAGTAGGTLVTLQHRGEFVETVQIKVALGHDLDEVLAVLNSGEGGDEKTIRDADGSVIATYVTKPEMSDPEYSRWELTE